MNISTIIRHLKSKSRDDWDSEISITLSGGEADIDLYHRVIQVKELLEAAFGDAITVKLDGKFLGNRTVKEVSGFFKVYTSTYPVYENLKLKLQGSNSTLRAAIIMARASDSLNKNSLEKLLSELR